MSTNLYVGSLPWAITDELLQNTFEEFGKVVSAKVVVDRGTGISRGFGFVEMENSSDADNAVKKLNNSELNSRSIVVSQAKVKE